MPRLKNYQIKSQLKKISVRVPKTNIAKINKDIELSKYNKKQKTLWIEDVLNDFFDISNYTEMVSIEFIKAGTTHLVYFNLSDEILKKIDHIVTEVKENEKTETDRSSIIRSSITQRLLSSDGKLIGKIK